jgi:histidinol-phosphate/aromatic aminotransferase/cobyric acid decarboxylase-like protein
MNPFWSQIVCELSPYVPGEQSIANLVKLNTNESPFGPSPLALDVNAGRCGRYPAALSRPRGDRTARGARRWRSD